jgi:hypothetical protein
MIKNNVSLMLFYVGMSLLLVCGGLALSGFKNNFRMAYAVGTCERNDMLINDLALIELASRQYWNRKSAWNDNMRMMYLASKRYDIGAYPHKLRYRMSSLEQELFQLRLSYLETLRYVSSNNRSTCGFAKIRTAMNNLPTVSYSIQKNVDGAVVKAALSAKELARIEGSFNFDAQVHNIQRLVKDFAEEYEA